MGESGVSGKPSGEALTLFFRSLAVMFGSGVPINQALGLLSTQSEDKRMASVAAEIDRGIGQGLPLHAAFERQGHAFTGIQLGLLKVGERTGELEQVLVRLADYEEKRRQLMMKVRSALTYPAFLMALTTFLLVVIPPYLFQGLFAMLEDSDVELPLISQIVMAVSSFIRTPDFWVLCIAALVAFFIALPRLARNRAFQVGMIEVILRLPVMGRFYRVLVTTRFAQAMELQLEVGEGPLQGLPVAALAAACPVLENKIPDSLASLKGGATFVEALEAAEYFPDSFVLMLRAGEESAELPDIMARTSAMYQSELDHAIETFANLLEPIIMMVMGILVGIVVVATMLPMMKMIQNL